MSYQGVLTDGTGTVVADGSYSLAFKVHDVSTGGSALWTETQSVSTQKGVFSVILGSVTPIGLRFDKPYWLGIAVGSGAELTPRSALSSTPYSFRAMRSDTATTLGGYAVSGTPAANTILPLDGTGHVPAAAIPAQTPTSHVLTVSGDAFTPWSSSVSYVGGSGMGGAYVTSGSSVLRAPVYLPNGATVTKFEAFFDNISTSCTVSVSLCIQYLSGGYAQMAEVKSTGVTNYGSTSTTSITSSIIDANKPYIVWVYSANWDGSNLRVMGAKITYTY
jgi:hypothetical protein